MSEKVEIIASVEELEKGRLFFALENEFSAEKNLTIIDGGESEDIDSLLQAIHIGDTIKITFEVINKEVKSE
jgi:hypothetical protein